jgi:hypothetical protein
MRGRDNELARKQRMERERDRWACGENGGERLEFLGRRGEKEGIREGGNQRRGEGGNLRRREGGKRERGKDEGQRGRK